jgi:hypothetical protein
MNILEKQWDCEHLELEKIEIEVDQSPEQKSLTTVSAYFCKECRLEVEV